MLLELVFQTVVVAFLSIAFALSKPYWQKFRQLDGFNLHYRGNIAGGCSKIAPSLRSTGSQLLQGATAA